MIYIFIAYIVASLAVIFTAWRDAGWVAGTCALGALILSTMAGTGLRSSMYKDINHKLAGLIIAGVLMGILSFFLAPKFSVNIAGLDLTGLAWGWIGAAIAFVSVNRKIAEVPS